MFFYHTSTNFTVKRWEELILLVGWQDFTVYGSNQESVIGHCLDSAQKAGYGADVLTEGFNC